MTDIFGLFGIVLCLYSCLRALGSPTDRSTITWLCFAVIANTIFGSSRQIAWLGVLVMVPSLLWLLRSRRRVFLIGSAIMLAGALSIFACLQWFAHQPYIQPEHLLVSNFSVARASESLLLALLDAPFLLLPIAAVFFAEVRRSRIRVLAVVAALAFAFLATYPSHLRGLFSPLLEPTLIDWVTIYGIYEGIMLNGQAPILLPTALRVLLTVVSFGGLIGLIVAILRARSGPPFEDSSARISLKQLGVLLAPVSIVYTMLLIPRAASFALFDRYLLELLVFALLYFVRFYQDRIHSRLPRATALLIAGMAIYGIVVTHNNFAFYRARVALAAELSANGAPDTSVDNGWEYNLGVELRHSDHVNDPEIVVPAHAYTPVPPPPAGPCQMFWYNYTPHIHPLYGISFDPNACDGPAPFAPVHYSRWPHLAPGTLYAVRYTAPSVK